jgi:hypothetical protein
MAKKRKVSFCGNTYYVGAKVPKHKCPEKCVNLGRVCAYRLRITGMSGMRDASTMCGYMYFTGRTRNSYDPDFCDKWANKLPDDILMTFWGDEEEESGSIYDE